MNYKVFYNEDDVVKLVCPECNYSKTVNITKFKDINQTKLTCKCHCGHIYTVSLEEKKEVREDIFLPGKYVFCDGRGQGDLIVTRLSDAGLSFEIGQEHLFKRDDIFFVEYRLDNATQSLITHEVIAKKVSGTTVEADFY